MCDPIGTRRELFHLPIPSVCQMVGIPITPVLVFTRESESRRIRKLLEHILFYILNRFACPTLLRCLSLFDVDANFESVH